MLKNVPISSGPVMNIKLALKLSHLIFLATFGWLQNLIGDMGRQYFQHWLATKLNRRHGPAIFFTQTNVNKN